MPKKRIKLPYKDHVVNTGFRDFLQLSKVSVISIARQLKRTRVTVSSWKSGRHMPSVDSFFRLVWSMNAIMPGSGDSYLEEVRKAAVADIASPDEKD